MTLRINVEWLDGEGVLPPELGETFAQLTISLGKTSLTEHFAPEIEERSQWLAIPVYPLALWMADNWWRLFYEAKRSDIEDQRVHSMAYASRGFPYPHISFFELSERLMSLHAEPTTSKFAGIHFQFERKYIQVSKSSLMAECEKFVSGVVRRLVKKNVFETPLQFVWEAISSCGRNEKRFCQTVGRFGLDPYSITDSEIETLSDVLRQLDSFDLQDVSAAISFEDAVHQSEILAKRYSLAREISTPVSRELESLNSSLGQLRWPRQAHRQGYLMAREMRNRLGLNDKDYINVRELFHHYQIPTEYAGEREEFNGVDSVIYRNHSVGVSIGREQNRQKVRFNMARALCESLLTGMSGRTVNDSGTFHQRRNRAFAAELLAPMSRISNYVSGKNVSELDIENMADVFAVSPQLIEHQVENYIHS